MGLIAAIVAAWALAEATVFFVVPDVPLTFVALLRGWWTAIRCAVLASVAAAFGGAVLWFCAAGNAQTVFAALDWVPAVSPEMIDRVRQEMATEAWPWCLVEGAFSGTPYKLFAAAAGEHGISLMLLEAVSVPARLARFLVVLVGVALAQVVLHRLGLARHTMRIAVAGWVVFYAAFWSLMPW